MFEPHIRSNPIKLHSDKNTRLYKFNNLERFVQTFEKLHFSIREEYLFYITTPTHLYAVNYTQNT